MTEALERRIALACSKSHAFRVFTEMTDLWWPRGHRRTEHAKLILQPVKGGRLYEKAPDGSEWTIGEIAVFEPPNRLEFDWFPGSQTAPTRVTVTFSGGTKTAEIHILHRAISDGSRESWPTKAHLFEKGWDTILPEFQRLAAA